jgi:uncharacterized protein YuzE
MKLYYDPETDSLYINLVDRPSVDSQEVAPGIVMDYAEEGRAVGIDAEYASKALDLSELEAHCHPVAVIRPTA